jgi:protein-disulfide isomerase
MDDPQKYEQYQHEKSLRDFTQGAAAQYDITDSPVLGPKEARIKVVEYADFLCPFCRNLAQGLHNYLPTTEGRVATYYKFYPLDNACNAAIPRAVHPGACALAMGGVCAMKQGKFGPYHDKVVITEFKEPPTNADAIKLAGDLGLNVPVFTTCMTAPATRDRVAADAAEGAKIGVTGTPTIFINGRKLPRIQEFMEAIDQESKKLGMGPMPQPPPPAAPPK